MVAQTVSILIPSYNQEDIIEETLHSALSQTYKDIEVVVSDDASTDSTSQILKKWQEKYPEKLKVFLHKENLGVTKNHTRGLSECSGDFIVFLDGDDLFLPEKLEKQIAFMLDKPNCTICYHNVDVFDSATGDSIYLWSKRFGTRQGDIKDLVRYGNYLPAVSVMVRKKDIPTSGYDERVKVYSDWLFWLCTLDNGKGKICYLDEVLARYRRHANNLTNTARWKFIDQNLVLDIVSKKWAGVGFEIRMRRSEVQLMQALNNFSRKQYKLAIKNTTLAIKLGFPLFPWVRLILREVFFLIKNKFVSDKILRSIIHE